MSFIYTIHIANDDYHRIICQFKTDRSIVQYFRYQVICFVLVEEKFVLPRSEMKTRRRLR